jgi:predicted Rossmann fold nucleotide-binding protein DprA/Smf involved in DNA uptake
MSSPQKWRRFRPNSASYGQPLSLNASKKNGCDLLNSDEAVRIDDIVERSGLNLSEVLATLFWSGQEGIVRQMPGQPFC